MASIIFSEETLQRTFSTFPGGRPGVGLLFLRVSVGATALFHGASCLFCRDFRTFSAVMIGLLAVAIGCLLLIGFLTPVASALVALGGAVSAVSWLNGSPSCYLVQGPAIGFLIIMAISILLLGPGAYSLDSRLFGRREILIPKASPSAEDS